MSRNRRVPLTITVWYQGGPASSWVIRYRGRVRRFEGFVYLEDVMSYIMRDAGRVE